MDEKNEEKNITSLSDYLIGRDLNKTYEFRLSGQPDDAEPFLLRAITASENNKLANKYLTNGKKDTVGYTTAVCLAGIAYPNFKDPDFFHSAKEKFVATTPEELFSKMFTAGEVGQFQTEISEISGLNKDLSKKLRGDALNF